MTATGLRLGTLPLPEMETRPYKVGLRMGTFPSGSPSCVGAGLLFWHAMLSWSETVPPLGAATPQTCPSGGIETGLGIHPRPFSCESHELSP